MPYPPIYDVTYSYTGFQFSQQGISAFPGTQLDADLAGLQDSIDNVSVFMQSVLRSDGALQNGIVTYDSLSASLQTAGLVPADAWATGVQYASGVSVVINSSLYRAAVAHTSGVFATDLAAGKWVLVTALQAGTDGAGYGGTSVTSLTIGTGSKVFTTQAGLAYQNGARVRASSTANTSNWMEGLVNYSGTTLTMTSDKTNGSGTHGDWNFNIVGQPGVGDLSSANNLSDLANAATAATNLSAVRYASQSLTYAQKSQARANIDISDENVLDNGDFSIWQRGTASISCPAGSRTFLTDRWWVNPAGAACTQSRQTSVMPTSPKSKAALGVVGATSVTTVNIGQRIMSENIPGLKRMVTFQFWLYNSTGASVTPTLLLGTPTAVNNFGTVNNRLTQALSAVANGAMTQVSYSVDVSGYTDIDNGLQVEIQIPSGSLNSGAKEIRIAEVGIFASSVVANFPFTLFDRQLRRCKRHFNKSFPYSIAVAQNAGLSGAIVVSSSGSSAGAGSTSFRWDEMAGTPTVTTYNPSAANSSWRELNTPADRAAFIGEASPVGARAVINAVTVDAAQHAIHFTAEFEP